jgi:hypothetical protein
VVHCRSRTRGRPMRMSPRHHQARRDGTVRDSVMYSILQTEWRDVKRHLELRLARHQST